MFNQSMIIDAFEVKTYSVLTDKSDLYIKILNKKNICLLF